MGIEIYIGAAVGFAYLAFQYVVKNGYKKKCPKCDKWFALKLINSELISTKKTQKVKTSKEETGQMEILQKRGKTIIKPILRSTLKWVPAVVNRYKNRTECRFCKENFIDYTEETV
jgi:hypothetical protein